jgi:hypothetical protein
MKLAKWLLTFAFVLSFSSPQQNTESKPLQLQNSPSKTTLASQTRLHEAIPGQKSMPPRKVGTLTAKINGAQYAGDLFEEGISGHYEVTSGNKNYEIRLQWKYTTTASGIREDNVDLSHRNIDLTAEYINFNVSDKYIVSSGSVIVQNDGSKVIGMFSFTASVEGYTRNNSSSAHQVSDGTFEINYAK